MNRGILLAVAAAAALAACADQANPPLVASEAEGPPFPVFCGRPGATVDALRAEVEADRLFGLLDEDPLLISYYNEFTGTGLTFTKPAHPAHPGLICRQFVATDLGMRDDMEILCNGFYWACAQMVEEFRQRNVAFNDSLRQRFGATP